MWGIDLSRRRDVWTIVMQQSKSLRLIHLINKTHSTHSMRKDENCNICKKHLKKYCSGQYSTAIDSGVKAAFAFYIRKSSNTLTAILKRNMPFLLYIHARPCLSNVKNGWQNKNWLVLVGQRLSMPWRRICSNIDAAENLRTRFWRRYTL